MLKRLPFDCCSLSLRPFEDPVALADGTIFDIVSIVPYIKKFGTNPVTGKPLALEDLFKLHFHKNTDDQYSCPITYKVRCTSLRPWIRTPTSVRRPGVQ